MSGEALSTRLGRFLSSREFRRHPARSVGRRVYWRVHWRFRARSPFIIRLDSGLNIRLARSSASSGIYLNGGSSDGSIGQLFAEFLKPGMVAFDCGAHIGEYTLLFSSLVGPQGQVHCFEPDPRVFAYLSENVSANRLHNVVLNSFAVGNHEGEGKFVLQPDATMSSLLPYADVLGLAEISVRITTLDRYIQSRGLSRVDALKIDCEGAERAIVSGAGLLLSELRPSLVFIECDHHEHASPLVEELNRFGYETQVDNGHLHPHLIARKK